jgi:hypothetical protein
MYLNKVGMHQHTQSHIKQAPIGTLNYTPCQQGSASLPVFQYVMIIRWPENHVLCHAD